VRRVRPALAALLALLAAAAPASAAGTTVYLHLIDGLQDMPMNPQPPPSGYGVDLTVAGDSLGCVPNPPAVRPFQEFHTFYGYATPRPLAYETALGARLQEPRAEPVRGIVADVPLQGATMTLHWVWSTARAGVSNPTVLPNVVVRGVLRSNDAISVDDSAYNSGTVLAEGESAPATLAGDASTGVQHDTVGGRDVYDFTVPLQVKAGAIPAATGYNLRVDTYVLRDACPQGGYLMPNALTLHSSPAHRPRLEIGTVVAPRIAPVAAQHENGTVVFDVSALSPWGPVDVANVTASITGPSSADTLDVTDPFVLDAGCHCGDAFGSASSEFHDSRVVWDAAADHAKPGAYTLHLALTNLQGTAKATQDVPFTVAGAKESPALAPLGVVGALALAAIGLRRHR